MGPDVTETHDVTWEGTFSKVDVDKRQVFGWASVTEMDGKPVVDLQGDYIHPTDMENAAYDYVMKSRIGGDMHSRTDEHGHIIKADKPLHVSDLIESMVFTPEKIAKLGLAPGSLPTGWWCGFKVHDDRTWAEVKKGNRRGFSIHGAGVRKTIEDPRYVTDVIGKAMSMPGLHMPSFRPPGVHALMGGNPAPAPAPAGGVSTPSRPMRPPSVAAAIGGVAKGVSRAAQSTKSNSAQMAAHAAQEATQQVVPFVAQQVQQQQQMAAQQQAEQQAMQMQMPAMPQPQMPQVRQPKPQVRTQILQRPTILGPRDSSRHSNSV